jgi:hypothetical protein
VVFLSPYKHKTQDKGLFALFSFSPMQTRCYQWVLSLLVEGTIDSLRADGLEPARLGGNVMPSEVACRAVASAEAGGISQFFLEQTNELTFSNIQRLTPINREQASNV